MGKKIIVPGADFSQNGIRYYEYPINSLTSCGGSISSNSETLIWQESDRYYGGLVLLENLSGYSRVAIKTGTVNKSGSFGTVSFLKETEPNIGETPQFATGWNLQLFSEGNKWYYFDIPSDALSLYLYLQSPGYNFRPQYIYFE